MKKLIILLYLVFCLASLSHAGSLSAFFGGGGSCTWDNATITSNSTFTVPAGVTEVFIDMCGGGGGGGARNAADGGGGGQAGNSVSWYKISVSPGEAISVVIGGGGTAGTGTDAGGAGESSLFSGYLTVIGGAGGYGTNICAGCGGGPYGSSIVTTKNSYTILGSASGQNLVMEGASGGSGDNDGVGVDGGMDNLSFRSATAVDEDGGGGGSGLFGRVASGNEGTSAPVNSGAGANGGAGVASTGGQGGSGMCIVRWCK